MTFAARSTLRRLHRTVQRSLHKHQRNGSTNTKTKSSKTSNHDGGHVPPSAPPSSGSYSAWLEPIKIPFRAYSSMQARSPLTVQLESSLIIYLLGDLSAQLVQTSSFTEGRYEPIRGLRAMVIGGLSSIPSYKWFMWLGRNFNYDTHWKGLVVKILVSQTLFTPVFNTYFFGMQTLLSGGTLKETIDRVKKTVPVSWVNSWKLWPFVTAFSFTFIPPHHRNVFAGFIAIGWQTYLSWLNTAAEAELRAQEKAKALLGMQEDGKNSKLRRRIEQR